jgi:hypothetical protein
MTRLQFATGEYMLFDSEYEAVLELARVAAMGVDACLVGVL